MGVKLTIADLDLKTEKESGITWLLFSHVFYTYLYNLKSFYFSNKIQQSSCEL